MAGGAVVDRRTAAVDILCDVRGDRLLAQLEDKIAWRHNSFRYRASRAAGDQYGARSARANWSAYCCGRHSDMLGPRRWHC